MNLLSWFLIALIASTALMVLLWSLQLRSRNANLVDVAWTVLIGGTGIFGVIVWDTADHRRLAIAALLLAWTLRLSLHLAHRMAGAPEDRRYARLRARFGRRDALGFLFVYIVQALLAVLVAITPFAAASADRPTLDVWDTIGIVWGTASLALEALADRQLRQFRTENAGTDKICDRGLWAWSRHPNYFFEWMHWWAYAFIGVGGTLHFGTLAAPILIYVLVVHVSGIPPLEAAALARRGAAWRDYQRRVPAFFPRPPRAGIEQ